MITGTSSQRTGAEIDAIKNGLLVLSEKVSTRTYDCRQEDLEALARDLAELFGLLRRLGLDIPRLGLD